MSWNVRVNDVQYHQYKKAPETTNFQTYGNTGNVNFINVTNNGAQIVLGPQNQNIPQYQTQTSFYSQPVGFMSPVQVSYPMAMQVPVQYQMQTAYQALINLNIRFPKETARIKLYIRGNTSRHRLSPFPTKILTLRTPQ
jgi:hypothetical protein